MDYRTALNFYTAACAVLRMARDPRVVAKAEERVAKCHANLIGAAAA